MLLPRDFDLYTTMDGDPGKSLAQDMLAYWTFEHSYSNVCTNDPPKQGTLTNSLYRPLVTTSSNGRGNGAEGRYYTRDNEHGASGGLVMDTGIRDSQPPVSTFTAAFWFKETDSACYRVGDCAGIVWFASGTKSWSNLIGRGAQGSPLALSWWASNLYGMGVGVELELNRWYHIVLVSDSRDAEEYKATVYINGEKQKQHTNSELTFTLGSEIAVMHYTGNGNHHYANGGIDELALWNRVLSPHEITAMYSVMLDGDADGVKHIASERCPWDYDPNAPPVSVLQQQVEVTSVCSDNMLNVLEPGATTVPLTALLHNGASLAPHDSPRGTSGVEMIIFAQDRDPDVEQTNTDANAPEQHQPYATLLPGLLLGGGGVTICAWVRYDRFESWSTVTDFSNGLDDNNLYFGNSGTSSTMHWQAHPSWTDFPGFWEIGVWVHGCVSVDAIGTRRAFKNGKQVGAAPTHEVPARVQRTKCFIGWSPRNAAPLHGAISNLLVLDGQAIKTDAHASRIMFADGPTKRWVFPLNAKDMSPSPTFSAAPGDRWVGTVKGSPSLQQGRLHTSLALGFDGSGTTPAVGQYVSIQNGTLVGGSALAVCGWVLPKAVQHRRIIDFGR